MPWPTYSPALPAPRSRGSPAAPDHNKGECGQAGPDPAAPPSAPPADPPPSPGSPVADTGTPRTFRRPAEPGAGPPASPPGYCGHPRSRPAATRASSTERRESPAGPAAGPHGDIPAAGPRAVPAHLPLVRTAGPDPAAPLQGSAVALSLRRGRGRRPPQQPPPPPPRWVPAAAGRAVPGAQGCAAGSIAQHRGSGAPLPRPRSPFSGVCVCVCVCKGGTTHREKKK